jgi:hypothetical protein
MLALHRDIAPVGVASKRHGADCTLEVAAVAAL